MESYGEFAAVYDRLMDDFDYPAWAEYYLELISRAGVKVRRMCDCACGTGSMSIQFAKRGINVTGMDISRDMLEIAAVRARRAAQKADKLQANVEKILGNLIAEAGWTV